MDGDLDCTDKFETVLHAARDCYLRGSNLLALAIDLAPEGVDVIPLWNGMEQGRGIAEKIDPPQDGWPKGDCQIFDLLTRARLA